MATGVEVTGGRKSFAKCRFPVSERNLIREAQNNFSYFSAGMWIQNFHHEPARRILLAKGIEHPDVAEFGMGLSVVDHAAIHWVAYNYYDDLRDRQANRELVNFLPKEQKELYFEIIDGCLRSTVARWMQEVIITRREKLLRKVAGIN